MPTDPDRLERKLAAILYADVAGYSRLTGEDEEGTHRRLSAYLDATTATCTTPVMPCWRISPRCPMRLSAQRPFKKTSKCVTKIFRITVRFSSVLASI